MPYGDASLPRPLSLQQRRVNESQSVDARITGGIGGMALGKIRARVVGAAANFIAGGRRIKWRAGRLAITVRAGGLLTFSQPARVGQNMREWCRVLGRKT